MLHLVTPAASSAHRTQLVRQRHTCSRRVVRSAGWHWRCCSLPHTNLSFSYIAKRFRTGRDLQSCAATSSSSLHRNDLTLDQLEDALDYATSFVSMLPLLRPVDPLIFNPAYEIWTRIAAIPPQHRPELLERLEDGALRILWKYSVFRYVWDEQQTAECMRDWALLDDFPSQPGQVYTYLGRVENCILKAEDRMEQLEDGMVPHTPQEYETEPTGQRFEQFFFPHPETGDLMSRVKMPNWLGLVPWSLVPWYCRADVQLVTTPVKADAGADVTLVYQDNPAEPKAIISSEALPFWWWPDPVSDMESPHSESERDYLRACGPGVYVGCAYCTPKPGEYEEHNFKFFLLVRDPRRDRQGEVVGKEEREQEQTEQGQREQERQ